MLASKEDGLSVVTQPWGLGRRIAAATVLFLAIGFIVFAAAGSGGDGRLTGAGSTLVNPILQRMSTAYQGYLAANRVDAASQTGTSGDWTPGASALDYDPVGSLGGLMRLDDPMVTFAATEVPMTAQELQDRDLVQFPLILGAVAPVMNLDLDGGTLILDAGVLARIFSGSITDWSDSAIAALNPNVALPDKAIAVRYRSDGSGTTWTFTGYLATTPQWTNGQFAKNDWPAGQSVQGNRGMIDSVAATPGAIGYAEVGQARRAGLAVADLIGTGGAVSARTSTIQTASADGGWPMTATVHVVMRANPQHAGHDRALAFFRYFYAEAQRQADVLGYVALPADAVAAVETHWTNAFKTDPRRGPAAPTQR